MRLNLLFTSLHIIRALALPLLHQSRSPTFSRLVVFGDSFSDDGNGAWKVSNETWPADPAYYNHMFSNGPVWNILVAQSLGLQLANLATGGATANNDFVTGYTGPHGDILVPSSNQQIASFLSEDEGTRDGDIYVLWIGANDVLFNPNITGSQVTSLVATQVDILFRNGAKTVLLPTYPHLSRLPGAQPPAYSSSALDAYTSTLASGLKNIVAAYSAYMTISLVDTIALFDDIIVDPEKYGITLDYVVPPAPCLLAYSGNGERSPCTDPDRHLWWDEYHPTRGVHAKVAEVFEGVIREL